VIPLIVLVVAFGGFRAVGLLGVSILNSWSSALRAALSVMFLVTASAHWGKRRPDLIRTVPPQLPRPDLLVTLTGVLEILGAIGLLVPWTSRAAAWGLALMLIAVFPANVHAARAHLRIGGRPVPALPTRTALQVLFLAALVAIATAE
jgi:uncharacterized membrane protein